MATYSLVISGCDDRTTVTLELTDAEHAAIDKLRSACDQASEYGCQPTMRWVTLDADGYPVDTP